MVANDLENLGFQLGINAAVGLDVSGTPQQHDT